MPAAPGCSRSSAGCAQRLPVSSLPEAPTGSAAISVEAMHHELSEFRYCTVFVIEGDGLDADALERELEVLGDSLLVVGDATALKIHVHTDDPGAALSIGTARGTIEGVEIADMHRQTLEREERLTEGSLAGLPTLETGVVVVAPGEGNRRLFESMRATRVIEGGQTMNPSTEDIVAAVDATPATEVIVLPNNKNVILSAEQAIGLVEQADAGACRRCRCRRASLRWSSTTRSVQPATTRSRCFAPRRASSPGR